MLAKSTMKEDCVLTTLGGFVKTPGGGGYYAEPTNTPSVCRVAPLGGSPAERMIADRHTEINLLAVYVPWDAEVEEVDTITLRGQTHQILGRIPKRTFNVERQLVIEARDA